MSWQWLNPPPLVVLMGSMEFLLRRELKKALVAATKSHREISIIKGDDRDSLSSVLSSTGVFFKGTSLVVVENPEKVDVGMLKEHQARGNNATCVVLVQEGSFKARGTLAKFVQTLPKEVVAKYEAPPPWKETEETVGFLVGEAQRRKLKLDWSLATGMVQNIGTDYGILSFELDKIERLISARNDPKEITPEHVKAVMAAFTELGVLPIVDALGQRDLKKLSRALVNMHRTHGGPMSGATLKVCGLLSHNLSTWLTATILLARGASSDEIAERLKLHAFVVKKSILPVARRWTEEELVALVRALALIERGVKRGHVNSWIELECVLFRALESRTQAVG